MTEGCVSFYKFASVTQHKHRKTWTFGDYIGVWPALIKSNILRNGKQKNRH